MAEGMGEMRKWFSAALIALLLAAPSSAVEPAQQDVDWGPVLNKAVERWREEVANTPPEAPQPDEPKYTIPDALLAQHKGDGTCILPREDEEQFWGLTYLLDGDTNLYLVPCFGGHHVPYTFRIYIERDDTLRKFNQKYFAITDGESGWWATDRLPEVDFDPDQVTLTAHWVPRYGYYDCGAIGVWRLVENGFVADSFGIDDNCSDQTWEITEQIYHTD